MGEQVRDTNELAVVRQFGVRLLRQMNDDEVAANLLPIGNIHLITSESQICVEARAMAALN